MGLLFECVSQPSVLSWALAACENHLGLLGTPGGWAPLLGWPGVSPQQVHFYKTPVVFQLCSPRCYNPHFQEGASEAAKGRFWTNLLKK